MPADQDDLPGKSKLAEDGLSHLFDVLFLVLESIIDGQAQSDSQRRDSLDRALAVLGLLRGKDEVGRGKSRPRPFERNFFITAGEARRIKIEFAGQLWLRWYEERGQSSCTSRPSNREIVSAVIILLRV